MFSELMPGSESDKPELSAWRIALSENMHSDREARRVCREQEHDTQDEMVRIMREQTDMLRHLVEVEERQLDTRVPLHPMLNLLPLLPSPTSFSPRLPRMGGGLGGRGEAPVSLVLNSRGGYKEQKTPIPTALIVIVVQIVSNPSLFLPHLTVLSAP